MYRQQGSVVSIVIPAYNEEETIGSVIAETTEIMENLGLPYEILVVNDGSTDKTAYLASRHKVIVLSNEKNRGKGYALRKALSFARGDIIVTIDSDGEHEPKEIPDLVLPLFEGFDIVSGSRFLGKNAQVTTKLNRMGNFLFNVAVMTLTGKIVTDSQTGFRAARRQTLEKMNLESNGYEIEAEITVKGLINGFAFKEMPISCERRRHSFSKLRLLSDGPRILKTIITASLSEINH